MAEETLVGSSSQFPKISGYRILAEAGRGGMGVVYRAQQLSTHRLVALKLLVPHSRDEGTPEAFQREAELVAHLEHPRIVPLYDYGEQDGAPYLAMRYLPGGTLADRIQGAALPTGESVAWLSSVAEALDFAHSRGLVHRDVKPSNVLLDDAGNAYLTDFGIAGVLQEAGKGQATGSAAYMAPEQGRGEAAVPASDTYALAVTAFELLTGHKPYTAETALGVMVRHMQDPIPSAVALNPSLPPAVDRALARGMAKTPSGRPASAGGFVQELRQALETPAASQATAEVAARKKSGFPWGLAIGIMLVLGLGGVLLIGAGAIGFALLGRTPTPAPTSTKLATEAVTPQPSPLPPGILLRDDFSNPASGFGVKGDQDGGVAYQDGQLVVQALSAQVEWFSPSGKVKAEDVTMQVDFTVQSGPPQTEIGLACRWQDPSNYTVGVISPAGSYSFRQNRDGAVETLVDWTPSPALSGMAAGTHMLGMTCRGSDLLINLDGLPIGTAQDPDPLAGDIALMAGVAGQGPATVAFDNLLVEP